MNCTNCNSEMKQGYIQSKSLILWSEKKRKIMVFADNDNDVLIGEGGLFVAYKEAFRCPECGTIVIPSSIE